MKKITLVSLIVIIVMLMLAVSISAETVTDDDSDTITLEDCVINGVDPSIIPNPTVGLKYTFDDETGTATISGKGTFAGGELVIPSKVTYKNRVYNVTKT